jgi:hypothetical protein
MGASEETLALLKSIDATLKQLVSIARQQSASSGNAAVADDHDLDSQWGDETVKLNPRDWMGESYKGQPMSECPPDFLDQVAKACDYFAQKNEGKITDKGKPKSDFDRRTAARARGWAKRLRSGWKPPSASSTQSSGGDDYASSDGYGAADEPF